MCVRLYCAVRAPVLCCLWVHVGLCVCLMATYRYISSPFSYIPSAWFVCSIEPWVSVFALLAVHISFAKAQRCGPVALILHHLPHAHLHTNAYRDTPKGTCTCAYHKNRSKAFTCFAQMLPVLPIPHASVQQSPN